MEVTRARNIISRVNPKNGSCSDACSLVHKICVKNKRFELDVFLAPLRFEPGNAATVFPLIENVN